MTGLDIGSHSIKLASVQTTSKGTLISHLGVKEIPYGEQREDPAFISEAIKALYREVGLKPGKVSLTLSGLDVHLRRISLPFMPKRELKEAVRWEMKNQLPFPLESARIDFITLGESMEEGVKKLDLIGVACPMHLVDRALTIAMGAGLIPSHLTIGQVALWNLLLSKDYLKTDEVVGLLDFGAERTGIYIFRHGILQFSREITPGGMDLSRAIMEGLDPGENPQLLYERAEKIKHEMGIPDAAFYEKSTEQPAGRSKVLYLVRPVLERLASEIARSIEYYRNQSHVERIDRILMIGGGANLSHIVSYLRENLRLPVERFNPLDGFLVETERVSPDSLHQWGPLLAMALGAALPEQRRLELLPEKEPYWSKARVEKWIPRLAALTTLLIFAVLIWKLGTEVATLTQERDEKMAKVKTLETLQTRITLLKEKETKMKSDLSVFPPSAIAPPPFRQALTRVSQILPDNVTVISLSLQSGKPPADQKRPSKEEHPGNNSYELQIKGLAFGSDHHCLGALARIIEGLERSSIFKNARLVSADENKSYNLPAVGFEIVCELQQRGLFRGSPSGHGNPAKEEGEGSGRRKN